MKTYTCIIHETSQFSVNVTANNPEEAAETALDIHCNTGNTDFDSILHREVTQTFIQKK